MAKPTHLCIDPTFRNQKTACGLQLKYTDIINLFHHAIDDITCKSCKHTKLFHQIKTTPIHKRILK